MLFLRVSTKPRAKRKRSEIEVRAAVRRGKIHRACTFSVFEKMKFH